MVDKHPYRYGVGIIEFDCVNLDHVADARQDYNVSNKFGRLSIAKYGRTIQPYCTDSEARINEFGALFDQCSDFIKLLHLDKYNKASIGRNIRRRAIVVG